MRIANHTCVAGRLDAELLAVSKRVSKVLQRLQRQLLHGCKCLKEYSVLTLQGAWMRSCWR